MRYIVFEGPEGSGKSTVAGLLVDKLKAEGVSVLHIAEPFDLGGSPQYRTILKTIPLCVKEQALLFYANRVALMGTIRMALAEGKVVISDRSHISSHALQKNVLIKEQGPSAEDLFDMLDRFVDIVEPDMVIQITGSHRDHLANPNDALERSQIASIKDLEYSDAIHSVVAGYSNTAINVISNRRLDGGEHATEMAYNSVKALMEGR